MSEDNVTDKPLYTFQDIVRYMESVKAKTACPFCDGKHWSIDCMWDQFNTDIVSEVGAIPFASIPDSADFAVSNQVSTRGIAVIPFICDQCGFVRPHSFGMFRNWISKNPAAPDKTPAGTEPDA